MITILSMWGAWPQIDGGMRYALGAPANARRARAALRRNPAMADALEADCLVEREPDGRLVAHEWPGRREGRRPPWRAIHAALAATPG